MKSKSCVALKWGGSGRARRLQQREFGRVGTLCKEQVRPTDGILIKTRHVKVQYLWIQDAVLNKELEIGRVGTLENPADQVRGQ